MPVEVVPGLAHEIYERITEVYADLGVLATAVQLQTRDEVPEFITLERKLRPNAAHLPYPNKDDDHDLFVYRIEREYAHDPQPRVRQYVGRWAGTTSMQEPASSLSQNNDGVRLQRKELEATLVSLENAFPNTAPDASSHTWSMIRKEEAREFQRLFNVVCLDAKIDPSAFRDQLIATPHRSLEGAKLEAVSIFPDPNADKRYLTSQMEMVARLSTAPHHPSVISNIQYIPKGSRCDLSIHFTDATGRKLFLNPAERFGIDRAIAEQIGPGKMAYDIQKNR